MQSNQHHYGYGPCSTYNHANISFVNATLLNNTTEPQTVKVYTRPIVGGAIGELNEQYYATIPMNQQHTIVIPPGTAEIEVRVRWYPSGFYAMRYINNPDQDFLNVSINDFLKNAKFYYRPWDF